MCGIFGYVGSEPAGGLIHQGLKRLEYRGYDSWGIALASKDKILLDKKTGSIPETYQPLSDKLSAGIGHTRWATHGGVTDINAHPHLASDGSFAVAQNGIVENYQQLKASLEDDGYQFISDTDTEVIVRLIESRLSSYGNLQDAVRQAFTELEGRNTIIVLPLKQYETDLIAVRNGSPLVVGKDAAGIFVASDTLSFADKTNQVQLMEDNEMVVISGGQTKLYSALSGNELKRTFTEVDAVNSKIDKEGFDHFMLKEIYEQIFTITQAMQYSPEELAEFVDALKQAGTVYTVGAGTASYAAGQIAYYLRTIAGLKAFELKAYEIDSFRSGFTKGDIIIAVSQSGETADTLEALEIARDAGVRIASIVNMQGSTIPRMSEFSFLTRSGPEICVVSTKAFTAQCAWGLLVASVIAGKYSHIKQLAAEFETAIDQYFSDSSSMQATRQLADYLHRQEHIFILGRGQNYCMALEGALKLKETTYKHTEGFASGELKHGVIALVETGTPVILIATKDSHYSDILSAAAEVKARGAYVIGIANEPNALFDMHIPVAEPEGFSALSAIIPLQLTAYHLAIKLGLSPDKPRNLAKSVTVK